jgi:DNA-binding IclR family transcriptional regulator
VAIGDAARRGYSAVDFVSGVLDRLADATGLVARGWRVDDDSLVAVGRADAGRDGAEAARLPLAPPLGAVFMAWADEPTTEAWLARAAAVEGVRGAHDALPAIRGLGFGVTLASPEWAALIAPPPGPPPSPDTRRSLLLAVARQGLLPTSIEPDASYRPAEVAAPVFGAGGRVELTVAVTGPVDQDVTGARLLALGREVAAAADELTAAVRGLRPPAAPAT